MFNERQLNAFVKICQEKNITLAARKLFISQPALSQTVRQLENEVGAPLFIRHQNGVTLTQAGTVYYTACRDMLLLHSTALRKIQDLKDSNSGTITLGLSTVSARFLLPVFLSRFQNLFPLIELSLVETRVKEVSRLLLEGKIDLGLTYLTGEPGLTYQQVLCDRIFLEIPPAIPTNGLPVQKQRAGIPQLASPDFLDGQPFILLKQERGMRQLADAFFRQHDLHPRIVLETDSITLAHDLVQKNLGFTFLPGIALPALSAGQQIRICEFADAPLTRTLYMAYRQNQYMTRALSALIQLIGDCAGAPSGCTAAG